MTDLVATFPHRADVRRAVLDLERHGTVDADRIELSGLVDTTDELNRRAADREVMKDMGTRSVTGAALGAVLGFLVVGGIAMLLGADPRPAAPLAAAVGGMFAGGALGFFYGIAFRTPVTGDAIAGTTTQDGAEDDGPATIVVHLDDEGTARLVEARLRELGARDVDLRSGTAGG
jgi:hypothetical protein